MHVFGLWDEIHACTGTAYKRHTERPQSATRSKQKTFLPWTKRVNPCTSVLPRKRSKVAPYTGLGKSSISSVFVNNANGILNNAPCPQDTLTYNGPSGESRSNEVMSVLLVDLIVQHEKMREKHYINVSAKSMALCMWGEKHTQMGEIVV